VSPRNLLTVVLLMVGVLTLASASAQIPRDPDHGGLPPGRSAAPPPSLMGSQSPLPVVPDTVQVRITAPDSLPQPLAVWVVQDTLDFGGLLHLVLDYAPDQIDGLHLQVTAAADWLQPYAAPAPGFWARLLGRPTMPALDLTGLPQNDDLRVIRSFRVYRRDPLQVAWADELSPVLTVRGRTVDSERTATIRNPRSLAWTPWRPILLGLLLVAAALLLYWLWRRRRRPPELEHWPLPVPAWLAAAVGLQSLLAANILARGDTRLFLDRLAVLTRTYVAGRYRIAAREMTGQEIIRACTSLGYDPGQPTGFARLIDLADRERYNPEAPEPAFCREQAVQFMGRMGRVRLDGRHLAVPAEQWIAAEQAWSGLAAELGMGAGRAVRSPAAPAPEVH